MSAILPAVNAGPTDLNLNPERLIDEEAHRVQGISNKDLVDKPLFSEIADEFLEFIQGSTLIIHNAPFDLGFLNYESVLSYIVIYIYII